MAHNTDFIQWDALRANLEYLETEDAWNPREANLYFRFGPNQEQDIITFAESFSRTLLAHAERERQKYPEKYEPPNEDDTILDDETVLRIAPTISKWRHFEEPSPGGPRVSLCHHQEDVNDRFGEPEPPYPKSRGWTEDYDDYEDYVENEDDDDDDDDGFQFNCQCVLPLRERKVHAFLRRQRYADCYQFPSVNGAAWFNVDVVKSLLLHGEMDPVLRMCSHPEIQYGSWRRTTLCDCIPDDIGWGPLYKLAFQSYMALNLLYCFPQLRVSQPRRQRVRQNQLHRRDYRDTAVYQHTLCECTGSDISAIPVYAHRQFFGFQFNPDSPTGTRKEVHLLARALEEVGIPRRRPESKRGMEPLAKGGVRNFHTKEIPHGLVTFEQLRNRGEPSAPLLDPSTATEACRILRRRGLPEELVWQIIDLSTRELPVAHDPFHSANRQELRKYLDNCWNLMVRCHIFAVALGQDIDWRKKVVRWLSRRLSGVQGQALGWWDYETRASVRERRESEGGTGLDRATLINQFDALTLASEI